MGMEEMDDTSGSPFETVPSLGEIQSCGLVEPEDNDRAEWRLTVLNCPTCDPQVSTTWVIQGTPWHVSHFAPFNREEHCNGVIVYCMDERGNIVYAKRPTKAEMDEIERYLDGLIHEKEAYLREHVYPCLLPRPRLSRELTEEAFKAFLEAQSEAEFSHYSLQENPLSVFLSVFYEEAVPLQLSTTGLEAVLRVSPQKTLFLPLEEWMHNFLAKLWYQWDHQTFPALEELRISGAEAIAWLWQSPLPEPRYRLKRRTWKWDYTWERGTKKRFQVEVIRPLVDDDTWTFRKKAMYTSDFLFASLPLAKAVAQHLMGKGHPPKGDDWKENRWFLVEDSMTGTIVYDGSELIERWKHLYRCPECHTLLGYLHDRGCHVGNRDVELSQIVAGTSIVP